MTKKELKKYVEDYEIGYDYEQVYYDLYNACVDYMNDSQDWSLEYCFEDIITYDTAEDIAKGELERGGLLRLYYFMGDANFNNNLFRINGYGNLINIYKDDLEDLKQDILDELKEE